MAESMVKAAEESEGSALATKSAIWRVRAAQTQLAEIEKSLNERLCSIDRYWREDNA